MTGELSRSKSNRQISTKVPKKRGSRRAGDEPLGSPLDLRDLPPRLRANLDGGKRFNESERGETRGDARDDAGMT